MNGTESVQTVLGRIRLPELGRVLTHEHVAVDFTAFYTAPPNRLTRFLNEQIKLHTVGLVKQYPYSNMFNITFNDVETAYAVLEDLRLFRYFGGGTIVENSSHGLKRDLLLMRTLSEKTGINIIAGTGFYVAKVQNVTTLNLSIENMYDLIMKEMTEGCDDCPLVKTGFIGEVGTSLPIEDFERRSIQATATAQAQLRCPVSFHPGRDSSIPAEIIRIYEEAGGDSRKAVMSHLDRTFPDKDALLEFADETRCYCQFDLFGTECSFYQLNPLIDMLSDAQRVDYVQHLRDEGKLERVLLSHDIHTKHRLVNYGGHGYAHIINNVLPKFRMRGFSEEEIEMLTVTNPKEWLFF
ncbi:phosphotriesterase-related protein-like isoform X1 [Vespa mandarinia]|uniref:phosphotriesterase-related protein-like isoform X1 n=2 Tax=Vespa mandarinia TaxID=7446 RepID=UPI00160CFD3B|nr:phosphotriesterase-related protein-like isoform X1 [Vespa mandarinia]